VLRDERNEAVDLTLILASCRLLELLFGHWLGQKEFIVILGREKGNVIRTFIHAKRA